MLKIADDFREFLGVSDINLRDITISGSNAAYSYTPNSDIDLHLLVDVPNDEVYRELFNAKKYQYNDQYHITIGGYDVELYVQDANKPAITQGEYSLLHDKWLQVPRRRRAEIDDDSTRNKYLTLKNRIDSAVASGHKSRMDALAEKIKKMRQTGLENHGEFGPENIAFKMLRSQGEIKKLYDARNQAASKQLSLKEREPQRVKYGYGIAEDVGASWDGVSPTTQMFLNEEPASDEDILKDFVEFCVAELNIEHMPQIRLRKDPQWPVMHKTFGHYMNDRQMLEVAWGHRHIMDVLRTVAHELTHKRQHEREDVPAKAGETGSRWENEANAKAGVLMRNYAQLHPEHFAASQGIGESSGYIPTATQVKDPRFEMALSQDVHPGQTGKEANKMALRTNAQGQPQIARANGLVESLAASLAAFKTLTEDDLFEINMGSKNLRKEAATTGAIAGMEFEMIVPNVEGNDDDGNMEADYSYDEGVSSIQGAYDFFYDGDYNSRGDVGRLRDKMQDEYYEWLSEAFDTRWDGDESEFVYNYIKENASADEIAEILGTEPGDYGEYPEPDRQAYLDAAEKVIEESHGNYWYDQARESAQEDFNQNADLESDWLESRDLNTMQDIENEYNMSWPHWEQQGGGEASIQDIAQEFENAIGRDVRASGNYHSGSVQRPSPTAQHYIVEPDGSLEADDGNDVGLEFVSPPLPIDDILSDLNKVKQWAKVYGCYTNDSTGLHINISVPNYSRENLDFVKLALLMGDEYVLDLFGRAGNTYAKPAIKMVRDQVRQKPDEAERLLDKMKGNLDSLASKAIHSGVTNKYTSINTKDGHIEFRSPGGDWLDQNFDQIENTLLRFTVAMSAALNPNMYREEYLKKLYKLLTQDQKGDDTIKYFSEYVAGKIPKAALRSFVKQAQLERNLKKGDTKGKKYWWSVGRPGYGAGVQVDATSREEAIEKGKKEYPDWANAQDMTAKPMSPYEEPPIKDPTGDAELDNIHQELGLQSPAGTTPNYEIYNLETGDALPNENFFAQNQEDALAHLDDYRRMGPHRLSWEQAIQTYSARRIGGNASLSNSTGRAATSTTGQWKIIDGLGRQLSVFRPYANTRASANELAAIWARENEFDGNYQVEPADEQPATPVSGSTTDLAQQRATPGTFTGAWKIIDADGNEMHRFSGIGNNQRDANRVATQWVQNNGYAYGTDIEVVPIMSWTC